MLICISPNPAVDRRLTTDALRRGEVNRARSVRPLAGGKAAHVAIAARALGEDVMWVGFAGGATGDALESGLCELGIPTTIVRTQAHTRMNLEIIEADGTVTELLEPGGEVTPNEVERFLAMCRDVFAECSIRSQVALSGSLPPGAPVDLYAHLTRLAHAHDCRVLLDTSGDALRHGLGAAPDLVKPNRDEAADVTELASHAMGSASGVARRLFDAGARSVAITLGSDGIYWQRDAGSAPLEARPPQVETGSAVGCGDSTLAGLAAAYSRGLSDEATVRLAVACGVANCLAPAPGLIAPADVERFEKMTSVSAAPTATREAPGAVAK